MTFPSLLDNIRDDKNMTFSMTESPDVTGRKVFIPLIPLRGSARGNQDLRLPDLRLPDSSAGHIFLTMHGVYFYDYRFTSDPVREVS